MLSLKSIVQALVEDDYSSSEEDRAPSPTPSAIPALSASPHAVQPAPVVPAASTRGPAESSPVASSVPQPGTLASSTPAPSAAPPSPAHPAQHTAAEPKHADAGDASLPAAPSEAHTKIQQLEQLVASLRRSLSAAVDTETALRSELEAAQQQQITVIAECRVAQANAAAAHDELQHAEHKCAAMQSRIQALEAAAAHTPVHTSAASRADSTYAAQLADAEHEIEMLTATAQAAKAELQAWRERCIVAEDRGAASALRIRALEDIISGWESAPQAAPAPAPAAAPPPSPASGTPAAAEPRSRELAQLERQVHQQRLQLVHLQEQLRKQAESKSASKAGSSPLPATAAAMPDISVPVIAQLVVSAMQFQSQRRGHPARNPSLQILASMLPFNPSQREALELDQPGGAHSHSSAAELSDAWLAFLQEEAKPR